MRPLSTAAEVRELDRRMIDDLGLPSIALMELASAGVARALQAHHHAHLGRVVVMVGGGNNGGDGWAVARWLHGWGHEVAVWPVADPRTEDARTMAAVAQAAGITTVTGVEGATLVVDALLGTGVSSAVRGDALAALTALQAFRGPVVAVDLPSGLHADTGERLGPVRAAERTVTFARAKRGLYAGSGPEVAGAVEVVDIGLAAATAHHELRGAVLLEAEDVPWPRRPPRAHKGTSGHLGIVAGSAEMAGAAVLCALGALAGEAGKVTLVAPRGAASRLASLPPEVMVRWVEGDRVARLPPLDWADAVVVGPGLGGGAPLAAELLADLTSWWATAPTPTVFDADALPATRSIARPPGPRVLTPHPGEAARRLGRSTPEIEGDRFAAARALATEARSVALLKGRFTLIDDGALTRVNPTGAPTLATGGTGDVLAGLVGALMGRGLDAVVAACTAAWWHGRAGEELGPGARASEIPTALRAAIASGR